jgi:hypothetical protein
MRKVYVDVKVKLIVQADDTQDVVEVLENMDYDFVASDSDDADIVYTEIKEWEITNSK